MGESWTGYLDEYGLFLHFKQSPRRFHERDPHDNGGGVGRVAVFVVRVLPECWQGSAQFICTYPERPAPARRCGDG